MDKIEAAHGTIAGTDHVITGKNNQDAFAWAQLTNGATIGVVCDGCGSSKHSEVGAKLGAQITVNHVSRIMGNTNGDYAEMDMVRGQIISELREVSRLFGPLVNLEDYFLFTIVGFYASVNGFAFTFSIGDGYTGCDGQMKQLEPNNDDVPSFLGYEVTRPKEVRQRGELNFKIDYYSEFSNIIVATDGFEDILNSQESNLPGKSTLVGPADQFWTEDKYFKNPDMINRRLRLMNTVSNKPDWKSERIVREKGLLHDDTTFIVARRVVDET